MTAEHLSYLDLWQPIVVNERINNPRFFELIGLGGNQIEIEDGGFGGLFIDFEEPSLKGRDSFERSYGPKTFEAIDEYH